MAKPKSAATAGKSKVGAEGTAAKTATKSPKAAPKAAKTAKAAKGAASTKASKAAEEKEKKLGLRGAAPWAARHAAKHAAEARARAALPPPPGSARLTIRTPQAAEDIKARVLHVHNSLTQIKSLRKNLNKGFFEIGLALREIRDQKSYEAKGFGTFEAFVEREMADLGKITALRLVKLVAIFQREAALELGMERVFQGLTAIEADPTSDRVSSPKMPPAPVSTSALPLRPPGR